MGNERCGGLDIGPRIFDWEDSVKSDALGVRRELLDRSRGGGRACSDLTSAAEAACFKKAALGSRKAT